MSLVQYQLTMLFEPYNCSGSFMVYDLNFFLQHYGVFLQVPGVFSIFRPRACTYRSEPDSCRLAYGTAPFGPIECKQLLMDVPCVYVH